MDIVHDLFWRVKIEIRSSRMATMPGFFGRVLPLQSGQVVQK